MHVFRYISIHHNLVPTLQGPYSDLSVRLFVRPSVCLSVRLSVRNRLPEQFLFHWPNLAPTPLDKGCAVTLNYCSSYKIKVIAEL